MMSYPRKLFQGTVVILNFGIQDKKCKNIEGKLWAGNHPINLIWYSLDGIPHDTKWNPDGDIQQFIIIPNHEHEFINEKLVRN